MLIFQKLMWTVFTVLLLYIIKTEALKLSGEISFPGNARLFDTSCIHLRIQKDIQCDDEMGCNNPFLVEYDLKNPILNDGKVKYEFDISSLQPGLYILQTKVNTFKCKPAEEAMRYGDYFNDEAVSFEIDADNDGEITKDFKLVIYEKGCFYKGFTYKTGDNMKQDCNNCVCGASGFFGCTLMGCFTPKAKCQHEAKEFENKQNPVVGAFRPQCDENGDYKVSQCHPSTGYCFCVYPRFGNEVKGTSTGPGQPAFKCPKTQCQIQLHHSKNGRGLVLGGHVPECEENGDYKKEQCHGSTGYCWCTDPSTGKVIPNTRRGPTEDKVDCDNVKALQHSGEISLKLSGEISFPGNVKLFDTSCIHLRIQKDIQCDDEMGCNNPFLVEYDLKNPILNDGTVKYEFDISSLQPGLYILQTKVNTLKCKPAEEAMRYGDYFNDEAVSFEVNADSEGEITKDFKLVIHEKGCIHKGFTYKTGDRVKHDCNNCICGASGLFACTLMGCFTPKSKCQNEAKEFENQENPVVGAFRPQCDENGDYKVSQCHPSTGYCFCVHPKTGIEVQGSSTGPGQPTFKCPKSAHVPECEENGDYKKQQCHGSTGYCWCADPSTGKVIPNTRRGPTEDKVDCDNVKCLFEAHRFKTQERPRIGGFIPQCKINGEYKEEQCHGSTGFCWCVHPKTGERLARTETPPGPRNIKCPKTQCQLVVHQSKGKILALGAHVPECEENGDFKKQQCRGSTGYCWCADPNTGNVIPNTRRGPTEDKVDCDNINKKDDNECKPGDVKYQQCNSCTCNKRGDLMCTRIGCRRGYCYHEGKPYKKGESIYKDCNTCICNVPDENEFGRFGCTEQACLPTPPTPEFFGCSYKGKNYPYGKGFITDDCTGACRCTKDGGIACVSLCPPTIVKCKPGFVAKEAEYPVGEKCTCKRHLCVPEGKQEGKCTPGKQYWNDCNRCSCSKSGFMFCTEKGCPPGVCYHKGEAYKHEQKFKDGCKHCTCTVTDIKRNGVITCDETRCIKVVPQSARLQVEKNCREHHAEASEKAKRLLGVYVPACKENGYYTEKQCHNSANFCWCVEPKTGKKFLDSEAAGLEPKYTCKTQCQIHLEAIQQSNLVKSGLVGVYQPACKESGEYAEEQCHPSTGYCWCVNGDTGKKIYGTESRPGGKRTNCKHECKVDGKTYKLGEKYDKGDPCQSCECTTSDFEICAMTDCMPPSCKGAVLKPGTCCEYTCPSCERACTLHYAPVCGSNKKTYPNKCAFVVAKCYDNSLTHTTGACEKDCKRVCPLYLAPVCGSNGKTYSNKCFFDVAKCSDDSLTYRPENCCEKPCTREYKPICGSDGKTYGNLCLFEIGQCRNKKLTVANPGECGCEDDGKTFKIGEKYQKGGDPCITCTCTSEGRSCVAMSCRLPSCENPIRKPGTCCEYTCPSCERACPLNYAPVCGSNKKTYPNKCAFDAAKCYDNSLTHTTGDCCEKPCTREYKPICGSDGKTYANLCLFEIGQCRNKKLTVAKPGECGCEDDGKTFKIGEKYQKGGDPCITCTCTSKGRSCLAVSCRLPPCKNPVRKPGTCCEYTCPSCEKPCPRHLREMCGSDGQTYGNECLFRIGQCKNPELTLANEGRCCKQSCDEAKLRPVCGSNGQTYPNQCEFNNAQCVDQSLTMTLGVCANIKSPDASLQQIGLLKDCDKPVAKCTLDPCSKLDCNSQSDAICKTNKCGGCFPEFFLDGLKVECAEPKCREACTYENDPQCGSDGKTYSNMCDLEVAHCLDNSINFDHIGKCTDGPPVEPTAPCFDKHKENDKLKCTPDGKFFSKQCDDNDCWCVDKETGDEIAGTRNSDKENVDCGNDHRAKSGHSETAHDECNGLPHVTCGFKPCAQLYCDKRENATCKENFCGGCNAEFYENGEKIQCEKPLCRTGCFFDYNPLCGSDGKTYDNECLLETAQCNDNSIMLRHAGRCKDENKGKCHIASEEYEKRKSNGIPLVGAHKPDCNDDGSFRPKQCNPSAATCWCVYKNTGEQIPGTSARTFIKNIQCQETVYTKPKNCDRPCPKIHRPVCANNLQNYANPCLFENAKCKDDTLRIVRCRQTQKIRACYRPCPYRYHPVCGSDGKTYNNHCKFHVAKCGNPTLKMLSRTKCKSCRNGLKKVECKDDPCKSGFCAAFPHAMCYVNRCGGCQAEYSIMRKRVDCGTECKNTCAGREKYIVCGTDNKEYDNECEINHQKCLTDGKVQLKHVGPCE